MSLGATIGMRTGKAIFPTALALAALAATGRVPAGASELRGVSPVTDRVLMLVVADGKPVRETLKGGGLDGHIVREPVDLGLVLNAATYSITSQDDPAYGAGVHPERVGRKSKGEDFVRNGGNIEWVNVHALYLALRQPMKRGKTYTVSTGALGAKPGSATFLFDERTLRSDTVHVNGLGYAPGAPEKYAYLSAWMGDLGPLALDRYASSAFHLINARTGRVVFSGKPTLRKRLAEPDTGQPGESPNGNLTAADLWQMDFSAFKTPGTYRIEVDGIGCSTPFRIADDVYREAFVTVARGLYHQRCGIELKAPYTRWTRKACHRPETKPFLATTDSYLGHPHDDGDEQAATKATGEKRLVWGGWHDAGDWDREPWHVKAADTLLLAYELAPKHFTDGELNIPESGNGIPDIIDEAKWCIDYYRRIQRADGGVSVGFYESSFPKPGQASWDDPMGWYMYAEDPGMSYRYAASACRLAWCLQTAGRADMAPGYLASAEKAWNWAQKHTKPEYEARLRDDRLLAAACLYRATGRPAYEAAFQRDLTVNTPETLLTEWNVRDQAWAVWTYVLTNRPGMNAGLKTRLKAATLHYADRDYAEPAAKRGERFACNWWTPLAWGTATTPKCEALMVAHRLTGDAKYLTPQYTTCDYMLGANPLNMTWVTGLGPNHPHDVMHWDSWYSATGETVPGIVPMGPHGYVAKPAGFWQAGWAQQTCYPDAKQWPAGELWFENRYTPPTNEFTVLGLAEAAAAYGYLCGEKGK